MPFVKDPAAGFFDHVTAGRAAIINDAEAALPSKPADPTVAQAVVTGGSQAPVEKWFSSEPTPIGSGAADGSMSADFTIDVSFDDGWEWNRDVPIQVDQIGDRPKEMYDASVKGNPVVVRAVGSAGSALRVVVHIGAGADAFKRRQMEVQVSASFVATPVQASLPTSEQAAEQAASYSLALRDWETRCDELRAEARKAADEWESTMLRSLDPVSEIVNQLVKDPRNFPAEVRQAAWEVDLWQKLFEWEGASYMAYPGWWSEGPLRDPTRDPSDFVNASWVRLYLPVRVGMERLALRWIHKNTTSTLDATTEARFDAIEAELKKYREEKFGGELEMMAPDPHGVYQDKYDTIARWTDLLPTDGTHIEVVQGYSMAADAATLKASNDASELREAVTASRKQDARLKEKAFDQLSQPAALEVTIYTDGVASDER